jgi:hypothetical protein
MQAERQGFFEKYFTKTLTKREKYVILLTKEDRHRDG